ncbi:MAG: hypothetical protein ACREDC_00715 [Bradyrhizobium sp.]
MGLKKQEFYEGAALHLIAKAGNLNSVRYEQPFFLLNGKLAVLLKYSTGGRSPWGFTFSPDEQRELASRSGDISTSTAIALICGSDGVASFSYGDFLDVAPITAASVHIACYRSHGQYYEICGPAGSMDRKIPPSNWQKILDV